MFYQSLMLLGLIRIPSTSYFSFLTHYDYMVIAIPIHLNICVCVSVSVSVYMRVCVNGCVGFALLMFWSVTPSLLSTFLLHCSWIIAFILHICCVTVTPVHRCVCKWMCLFCTLDVLEFHPIIAVYFFSALWQICRLYTQKFAEFQKIKLKTYNFSVESDRWAPEFIKTVDLQIIFCVKRNKSCGSFTASSVHFNWKLQRFVHIGTFFEFHRNVGRSTYFQWAYVVMNSSVFLKKNHIWPDDGWLAFSGSSCSTASTSCVSRYCFLCPKHQQSQKWCTVWISSS